MHPGYAVAVDDELQLTATDGGQFVLRLGSDERGTLTVDRWRKRAVAETSGRRWEIKRQGLLRRAITATEQGAERLTLRGSQAAFAAGAEGSWNLERKGGRYIGTLEAQGGAIRAQGDRFNRSVSVVVPAGLPDGELAALTACFAVLRRGWDDLDAAAAA